MANGYVSLSPTPLLRPRSPSAMGSRSRAYLVTDPDGFIANPLEKEGLWVDGSRLISRYRWSVSGLTLMPVGNAWVDQHRWLGYYLFTRRAGAPPSEWAQEAIELRLSRSVGGGLHEDVDLTNHTQDEVTFTLQLEFDADFLASEDVRPEPQVRGRISRRWSRVGMGWELGIEYEAEHAYAHQGRQGAAKLVRGVTFAVPDAPPSLVRRDDGIEFVVTLAPHATRRLCLGWRPRTEHVPTDAPDTCAFRRQTPDRWQQSSDRFLARTTRYRGPEGSDLAADVLRTLAQATDDLAALRLHDLDDGDAAWTVAAGVPNYVLFFGRDGLIAASQAALAGPELARGTLARLAKLQASEVDDWHDAQPGRLIHELHTDPLSALKFDPHGRYYGDVTASLLYPCALARYWEWSGDEASVRAWLETAQRAVAWADRELRFDGVPFYRYHTRSEQGEKNQGWKDSNDAIVYPDGSQVEAPIGTCEMQGFAYAAKQALAGLLQTFGRTREAARLRSEAAELQRRFNEFFWMPDEETYGMAIGPHGELIRTVTSSPGMCLDSGIIDDSLAPATARRLLQSDLFSGWGLRTLSARHPAWNPFAYHRGTVWPAENAMVIRGLSRYGLHPEAHLLGRAQFELAAIHDRHRLPEVLAGHPRDDGHPFPAAYPAANSPQAWSASAALFMLEAFLGIQPHAPEGVLFLDPHLPEWLPEMTLLGLRVGDSSVDLRFRRSEALARFEILDCRGPLQVRPR